tara:strand:+ start:870 stop:1469 length:600 start_codon:yes stop_codon:yes gene_type:complete
MNVKTIIQLSIFLIIIIFLFFFLRNIFFKEKIKVIDLNENENISVDKIEEEKEEELTNKIEDIVYKSIDTEGNEYTIFAEISQESQEDSNVLILTKVEGIIKLKNYSDIIIKSEFAKYNNVTFDTNFYQNVTGFFEDKKFFSDNLDLFFKDNKAIMYNNIIFSDLKMQIKADEIFFNLSNGDIYIKMFNKNKKILITEN